MDESSGPQAVLTPEEKEEIVRRIGTAVSKGLLTVEDCLRLCEFAASASAQGIRIDEMIVLIWEHYPQHAGDIKQILNKEFRWFAHGSWPITIEYRKPGYEDDHAAQ